MLKGLAFLVAECVGPVAGDYGEDLFGGSSVLREVKPSNRTPRWRARSEGPPSNYDVALHLDFVDQAGFDAYLADDTHNAVAERNASLNELELTARVDWWYDGEPLTRRGMIRHSAMFLWAEESDEAQRRRALDAVRGLEGAPGVETVTIAENVGTMVTDYDWMYDVRLVDRDATERLLASDLYADAMRTVAPVTLYEWTARLSHVMRGTVKS
jgi:hypothetical protein